MPQSKLTAKDFTSLADPCIADFQKRNPSKHFSDIVDAEGRQYVNLVQKGGGILGIALVGYTYVLEKVGIRFMRLAGTSAGAINTALIASIGESRTEEKSERVIDVMANMNFFSFVDGPLVIRNLIGAVVRSANFSKRLIAIVGTLLTIFAVLLIAAPITYFLQWGIAHALLVAFSVYTFLLILLGLYVYTVMRRLRNAGFGLNPGDFFYDWIKKEMISNGVNNTDDLNAKAGKLPPLSMREGVTHELGVKKLGADVTFITAEIATQNKIEFPKMINLFRLPGTENEIHPAGFVRASMSIPVFFESYYISHIPCTEQQIKDNWQLLGENNPPSTARFVDGGILSNFPMSIFYNPEVRVPRLPSFGIDLDDSDPKDQLKNPRGWTFGGYIRNMFNTIRYYYDKDFLLKNKMFEKGVGKVPLRGYNWLNFFLTDREKLALFEAGAKAACDFLENFNWEDYKDTRTRYYDELQ